MKILETYTHPKTSKPQFLNNLAPAIFKYVASKAKARKMMASGELLVNGEKVGYDVRIFPDDVVTWT